MPVWLIKWNSYLFNKVPEMDRTLLLAILMNPFIVFAAFPLVVVAEDNQYARGVVIQALEPNKLDVGGREFKTKPNPKGEGVFVYDPRTRFSGVERNLIWIVLDDVAYPLNGPSKMLTPSLI
ncbi:MAG TPA: hypothetical protein DD706_18555 [Nitrospiraceae bacterium]|nr:hypothetical protein [Nitrospiraceae bacterium]